MCEGGNVIPTEVLIEDNWVEIAERVLSPSMLWYIGGEKHLS